MQKFKPSSIGNFSLCFGLLFLYFNCNSLYKASFNSRNIRYCNKFHVYLVGILLVDLLLLTRKRHSLLHIHQIVALLLCSCIFEIHTYFFISGISPVISLYSFSSILWKMLSLISSVFSPDITTFSCLFYLPWSDTKDSQGANFPHR